MDKQKKQFSNRQQGSTIAMVMILTIALTVAAASLLRLGTTEMRLNHGNFLSLEAQDGAESLINYAMAQVKDRWTRRATFLGDASDYLAVSPLQIPASAGTFLGSNFLDESSFEIGGGTVSDAVPTTVDGVWMLGRDVTLYSKVETAHPSLPSKQAYCETMFKMYSRSMFSYAIFYNKDLELNPGPEMLIEGPVHANGIIYLQALGGLKFDAKVSATEDIRYGDLYGNVTMTGDVQIKIGETTVGGVPEPIWSENFVADIDASGATIYYDSLHPDWTDTAHDRFNDMFEDGAAEVIIPVIDDVKGIGVVGNEAYALVEPLTDSTGKVNRSVDTVAPNQLAYKSGMIIKVEVNPSPATGEGKYKVTARKYRRSNTSDPSSEIVIDASGLVTLDPVSDPNPAPVVVGAPAVDPDAWLIDKGIITTNEYAESPSGAPSGGFFDKRQDKSLDIIELDIGKLREAIENDRDSDEYWNGALFVELPYHDPDPSRGDGVMVPYDDVALRLRNGENVPNPSHMKDEEGGIQGFTLATNGQLYVMGHYNADGDPATGSSSEPDDTDEIPAALAADSITILSENFQDDKSKSNARGHGRNGATYTEISAALITGTVTTAETYRSGGAHNLPRFLEDWGEVDFTYRGSMIAFFESEAGTRGFTDRWGDWYRAPVRDWGHHRYFAEGRDPPPLQGVPVFSFSGYRFIDAATYNAARLANPSFFATLE